MANRNGEILQCNSLWRDVLGWDLERLKHDSLFDHIHSDDVHAAHDVIDNLKENRPATLDYRVCCQDGSFQTVSWKWVLFTDGLIYGSGHNETETRRMQSFFGQMQRSAGIGSWEYDLTNDKVMWSNETHRMLGTDFKIFKPDLEKSVGLFAPGSREMIKSAILNLVDNNQPFLHELEMTKTTGEPLPVLISGHAELINGKMVRVFGTVQDISTQKKIEESLRRKKNRLELILESGNLGTWEWNLESNEVVFNERWCSMLGLDHRKVKHELSTWESLCHPDDLDKAYEDIRLHIAGKSPFYKNIHRLRHADGHWVHILDQGKVTEFKNDKPFLFVGTHTDITSEVERQREHDDHLAKALLSSKFAAIGEMAGGMAHEINNPLAIISAKASQMSSAIQKGQLNPGQMHDDLEVINKTVFRIAKIIGGLKNFTRQSESEPLSSCEVSQVLDETLALCAERFRNSGVDFQVSPYRKNLKIDCRHYQISQVLLNLLNNAFDAVQVLKEKWIRLEIQEFPESLEIRVTDSGQGILPEIQERMMMPFFTTNR